MFLAHINDLKENNIIPLLQYDKKWTLTNTGSEYNLTSNVCPHQSSLIVTTAQTDNRQCPYHGWQWDLNGCPLSSGSTEATCQNTKTLKTKPVYEFKGMLFESPVDQFPELDFLDFSYMKLVEQRVDRVNSNYANIMNIFLDQDHIPVLHKGLYDLIGVPTVEDLEWVYKENSCVQLTNVKQNTEAAEYINTLLLEDKNSKYGSMWLAIYPHTMIEWQPGALINTVCVPRSNNITDVIVYKYRDTRYSDKNWNINSSVWETAWSQDKGQAEIMVSVSSANLEEQKIHFINWLKERTDIQ